MRKKILTLTAVVSILFTACQNNSASHKGDKKNALPVETQNERKVTDIPFIVAKKYFVKSTVKSLDNPKIETTEKFNEIFGMATTMGKDGKPTKIDFQKQYVIAIVLPETDLLTTVAPVSLQKDEKGKITLTYKTEVGQKQSFTTRPTFQILVDKTENGNLELKEQN